MMAPNLRAGLTQSVSRVLRDDYNENARTLEIRTGWTYARCKAILFGGASLTVPEMIRLSEVFEPSATFWLNLQQFNERERLNRMLDRAEIAENSRFDVV